MAKKKAAPKRTPKTGGRKKGDPKIGGRKKGTPNREYDYAEATSCRICGSAQRSAYDKKKVWLLGATDPYRKKGFTHREERSCRCQACNRWRWEVSYVYSPGQRLGTFKCTDADQD